MAKWTEFTTWDTSTEKPGKSILIDIDKVISARPHNYPIDETKPGTALNMGNYDITVEAPYERVKTILWLSGKD